MIALLIYTAGSSPRDLETYVYPGVAEWMFINLYFAFGGGALGLVAWGGARLVAHRSASPLRRALASLYAVATVEILVLLPLIFTTSLLEILLDVHLIIPLTLSLLGTVGVVLWHERTGQPS
ncbi:hypothetical protein [Mycetocola spongiae]|uniref:hypothetical protein n=1 Tax=Mycetocola spongiae TaxID=2859226 RepID=UPI001CF4137F|nr:hypothetical protein [Mycetocola spongiae]UCR89825.1 hypothetical protein KXZ72_03895 [Mycetocola spongiae]